LELYFQYKIFIYILFFVIKVYQILH